MKETAGEFVVEAWDDGKPVWIHVYMKSNNEVRFAHLTIDDIDDLIYLLKKVRRKVRKNERT